MCPKLVKAALALVLFGGRQKHTGKNSVPVRGDPHVLMVGDPGLGKSQMLQVTQSDVTLLIQVCNTHVCLCVCVICVVCFICAGRV